ncbi:MAG: CRISPR-associated helicase/endonuclease Cas3 [Ruminiclostridium sp.]
MADQFSQEAGVFSKKDGGVLRQLATESAMYHDIGKLDKENQKVLSGELVAKSLPINHVDAGAAHWLGEQQFSAFSAAVTQAHHLGFPDFSEEQNKGDLIFRDKEIAADVDKQLPSFESIHSKLVGQCRSGLMDENISGDRSVFLRMLLSCIADADHTDTSTHYGKYPQDEQVVRLKADERLNRLNGCVINLQKSGVVTERNTLRSQMYQSCRDAEINTGICSCDSPVGSGKTTAIMAHLLAQAQKRGLRRIFVVLPFTNIIQQSVKTYREMLTLPGENPEAVVAELHHRADFESEDARHLTALWRAPIIVTTAVAFFETLASNSTATLRRLHELPGSAIFVDESHAALPATLLPIVWRWMRVLSDEWNCYWVLASGSMCRFWTIKDIAEKSDVLCVPEMVSPGIRNKLAAYEANRITYRYDPIPKSTDDLASWVVSFPGPRLVIMNTVQSAAVLADCIFQKYGRLKVEHLSTSLTPTDRETTLKCVKDRLNNKSDADWTLVATSCVEAGIDFSFKIGFHELSSLSSLLQAAGRVNREGNDDKAEMWTFRIAEDGMMKTNPGLKQAGEVLKDYFEENVHISPQLTTTSISDEIALYGLHGKPYELIKNEALQNFQSVERDFKVIDSDTKLAVVDAEIASQLRYGKINWKELQKVSVQIAKYKLYEMKAPLIVDNIYYWDSGYDSFLGYMSGIIQLKKYAGQALII